MTEDAKKITYNRARGFFDIRSEKGYINARDTFKQILDYADSQKYYDMCILELNKIQIEKENNRDFYYEKAIGLLDKPNITKVDSAEKIFVELDGYKDSDEYIKKCKELRALVMKKEKKGINKLKAAGLFCCGFGFIGIAIIACGMIFQSCA